MSLPTRHARDHPNHSRTGDDLLAQGGKAGQLTRFMAIATGDATVGRVLRVILLTVAVG